MKKIRAYKAKDGSVFETKEKCINYESICQVKEMLNQFVHELNAGRDEDSIDIDDNGVDDLSRSVLKHRKKFQKIFSYFDSIPRKKSAKKETHRT